MNSRGSSLERVRPRKAEMDAGQLPDWTERLSIIVRTMREMSMQTDPQAMVRAYIKRMQQLLPVDRMVSLSRRGLDDPQYRITRSSMWTDPINPWEQQELLPVLSGGLFRDLIYADEPRIIDDLEVAAGDPAADYCAGQQSLVAIPQYDQGLALNMVIMMREPRAAFDREQFPEMVWMSNLFGRATHKLVLSQQLQTAYDAIDHELKVVAEIQRSLLPVELPAISTIQFAVHYQACQRAGGDYYDFFPLPGDKWGILIADVSGHGTPAAVIMAILHTIAHTYPHTPDRPAEFLAHLNRHLCERNGTTTNFATAFYGVYDSRDRTMLYSSAGHHPPRIKHCSQDRISSLDAAQSLPLGVMTETTYNEQEQSLDPGDQIIFFTDGITEAMDRDHRMFGLDRLDRVLEDCCQDANGLINSVITAVNQFTDGLPADDDRTLLVGKVS